MEGEQIEEKKVGGWGHRKEGGRLSKLSAPHVSLGRKSGISRGGTEKGGGGTERKLIHIPPLLYPSLGPKDKVGDGKCREGEG